MGPSSLAFWLFGSKVLVLFLTTSALWHSVPHFSSKVPVLSSATSALWHFGFTHRKRRKEMTKRVIIFDALYIHKYQDQYFCA
ncbi:hypothetical protein RhiirA5_56120 [Rhizophagus irregularis]|uniref:Uncharacterized protein n=1 Tax=Rhizophagus irregularis TaxID=588596 RepID=A0A2N0Q419_9GLOM|nr:hypothetical protein RhiirA5_56120 [Rhizophagus irregularis]